MHTYPALLDQLPSMMEYIRSTGQLSFLDAKTRHRVELACEEALVNVIRYAFKGKDGFLNLLCNREKNIIVVVIKDNGLKFNPLEGEIHLKTDVPIMEREEGGLGLFLLRKMSDQANYRFEEGLNILTLKFDITNSCREC